MRKLNKNHEVHQKQLASLNAEYESKLKIAYEQRDKLVDEYERTKTDYKTRLDEILKDNKDALGHIEKEYRGKLLYQS